MILRNWGTVCNIPALGRWQDACPFKLIQDSACHLGTCSLAGSQVASHAGRLPLKIWDGMGTWDDLVIWGF